MPGAGLALLRLIDSIEQEAQRCEGDERTGLKIFARALEAPTRQIAANSEADAGVVVERMRAGLDPKRACDEILARVVAHHPEVKTNENAQLAFIAMNKRGEVGGAALRKQTKVFRYALMRGTKNAPALVDVKPLL